MPRFHCEGHGSTPGEGTKILHAMWLSQKRKKEKILIIPPFEAFLVAQMVKNLLAIQETWVRSLGWKDPVEKGMATHSSILAWRIPWNIPGRLWSMGSQ